MPNRKSKRQSVAFTVNEHKEILAAFEKEDFENLSEFLRSCVLKCVRHSQHVADHIANTPHVKNYETHFLMDVSGKIIGLSNQPIKYYGEQALGTNLTDWYEDKHLILKLRKALYDAVKNKEYTFFDSLQAFDGSCWDICIGPAKGPENIMGYANLLSPPIKASE